MLWESDENTRDRFPGPRGEVWSPRTVLAISLRCLPGDSLGRKTARLQRDLVFVLDTTLDDCNPSYMAHAHGVP